jgi:Zn-dependent protease with chaperone function
MNCSFGVLRKQRKYLADATAVQLTRDAVGLAKALASLSARGAPIPGGQYWCHLFVVGAEAGQARLQDDVLIEGQKIRAGCG